MSFNYVETQPSKKSSLFGHNLLSTEALHQLSDFVGPSLLVHQSGPIPSLMSRRFSRQARKNSYHPRYSINPDSDHEKTKSALGTPTTPKSRAMKKAVQKDGVLPGLSESEVYKPFKLSDKSTFNPANLTAKQVTKLDPITKAKYQAYAEPHPQIVAQINSSFSRVKKWNKERHGKVVEEYVKWKTLLDRKKGILGPVEEKLALENAQKAAQRMKAKHLEYVTAMDMELQFLVEGQKNSIDALRLKEHLMTKPSLVKLGKICAGKDKLRVEELLAD